MKLQDGTGTGSWAKVDSKGRVRTYSVVETEALHEAIEGQAYNVNTGEISFSAAGTLLYIENNEDKDLVIEALAVGVGNTGTHSDIGLVTISFNPTGGDLISDATAAAMNANRNAGSSRSLDVNAYKGKSGGTVTGDTDVGIFYQGGNGRLFANINLVVPKGSSMAVQYDPHLSSGSVNAYCAVVCFLE